MMNVGLNRMGLALLAACIAGVLAPANAQAQANGGGAYANATAGAAQPDSTAAELQQLLRDGKVLELRTVYNGAYGASMLFSASDLNYYATLFQGNDFWRVVKTQDRGQAQQTYQAFAAQTEALGRAELNKVALQAQQTRTERLLAERNAQLNRLRADQALRAQQEAQIAEQQAQALRETQALIDQQRQTQQQLRSLQQQIDALLAEQRNVLPGGDDGYRGDYGYRGDNSYRGDNGYRGGDDGYRGGSGARQPPRKPARPLPPK
jgi:hypothetical protein